MLVWLTAIERGPNFINNRILCMNHANVFSDQTDDFIKTRWQFRLAYRNIQKSI